MDAAINDKLIRYQQLGEALKRLTSNPCRMPSYRALYRNLHNEIRQLESELATFKGVEADAA